MLSDQDGKLECRVNDQAAELTWKEHELDAISQKKLHDASRLERTVPLWITHGRGAFEEAHLSSNGRATHARPCALGKVCLDARGTWSRDRN